MMEVCFNLGYRLERAPCDPNGVITNDPKWIEKNWAGHDDRAAPRGARPLRMVSIEVGLERWAIASDGQASRRRVWAESLGGCPREVAARPRIRRRRVHRREWGRARAPPEKSTTSRRTEMKSDTGQGCRYCVRTNAELHDEVFRAVLGSTSPRFSRQRRRRVDSSSPMIIRASEPPMKQRRSCETGCGAGAITPTSIPATRCN